jgi:hypothetical protein
MDNLAGVPNTQNLSHTQFGGLKLDSIYAAVKGIQKRHGLLPPEPEQEPETRSSAFTPHAYGAPQSDSWQSSGW